MRILSRHRDYYDWVASYGVDTAVCYAREPRSLPFNDPTVVPFVRRHPPSRRTWEVATGSLRLSTLTVGIYPLVYHRWMVALKGNENWQVRLFETYGSLAAHLATLGTTWRPAWYDDDLPPPEPWPDARWRALGVPLFAWTDVGWSDHLLRLESPVPEGIFTRNPVLQDLRFTEVDAHDVFERIQNFLRLEAATPAEFDDRQKVQAHGFDKQSFRHRKPEE